MPELPVIQIEWLTDSNDCETCGSNYAEGARVLLNNEEFLDLQPSAHCYDGISYDDRQVFKAILEKLGYSVLED